MNIMHDYVVFTMHFNAKESQLKFIENKNQSDLELIFKVRLFGIVVVATFNGSSKIHNA